MPYSAYLQLPYSPFNIGMQPFGPPVILEHHPNCPIHQQAPTDVNVDIYKDVEAYMDWLIQNNPQDVQVLEETKKVFIYDGCDVEVLKTMTKEDSDY